jgi:putative sterol carrier protein
MPTVRETFDLMPSKLKADRAQGMNAVFQYEITGEGGGKWYLTVKDGACTVTEGEAPSPNLTVTMTAQDWLDLVASKLNPQMAFMSGKLKLKGDMGLAMKLGSLFSLG